MAVSREGERLAGRYRIIDRLGTGGMAAVYLCEDERLGRRVAVKRLHAETPGDTARRFRREAKLGASLNHANIVSIFDAVPDEDGVLIVMEYVDGPNLAQVLQREGRLETGRALEVLRGVAAALDYAHTAGVIHRDVKPANVLIGSRDEAKLADLGIATALESTRITHSGAVLGTVGYMAPEQIDGAEPRPSSDIYSLATVAFEVLSGHKARVGRTPVEIARRIVSEPPPYLSDVWPEAPPEAVEVLRRGMAKDPADRPATAGELVADLERALAPAPAEAAREPPAPPPPPAAIQRRERPRWLVPAALIAVLAALLVAGVLLLSSGGGDEDSREQGDAAGETRSGERPEQPRRAAPAPGGAPEDAVSSFYERAAADDFEGAWEVASPTFREQLGGYDAFVAQQSSLESIEFERLETTRSDDASGTVEIETVARHADRVDRCQGSLEVVRGDSGWLVERATTIDCRRE